MKSLSNYQVKQNQLEQLKDDFLSSISHELRSPLTNIKMATQMLKVLFQQDNEQSMTMLDRSGSKAQLEPTNSRLLSRAHEAYASSSSLKIKMVRYIKILERECDRETNLLNNVLDLQQLDAGTYGFSSAIIHLQDWLPAMIQPFLERIDQQHQRIAVDGVKNLPDITTDPLSLQRILSELLTNACKFTPPGGKILLTARLPQSPVESTQMLQLTLTNSKVEIPARKLPHLFERFYRVPNHDRWKHDGTGLGLALVKELVEHLGGSIAVESGDGQTSFTVTVPSDR